MRCLMCERKYREEHGDTAEGFCSISCRKVYEHIYGPCELMAEMAIKSKA
jgi:rubredoxin